MRQLAVARIVVIALLALVVGPGAQSAAFAQTQTLPLPARHTVPILPPAQPVTRTVLPAQTATVVGVLTTNTVSSVVTAGPLVGRAPSQFPAQQCCGGGNGWAPGDVDIAVSPGYVVETVNSSITVYQNAPGQPQLSHADLTALLGLTSPANACIDPTVIYSTSVDRFIISCSVLGQSDIKTLISTTNNPSGSYCIYTLNTPGPIDQPAATATTDKVIVNGNPGGGGDYVGVLQKSDMLACHVAREEIFNLPDNLFRASVQADETSDGRLYSCCPGGNLQQLDVTGTPDNNTVVATETALEAKTYSSEPDPPIPGGALGGGQQDSRILSAEEEFASAGNTRVALLSLTLPTCSGARSGDCAEIIKVKLGPTPSVVWDFRILESPKVTYSYPAVALDKSGDGYVTYTRSSATLAPQAAILAFNPSFSSFFFNRALQNASAGAGCGGGTSCDERWGDYLGAARDPGNPNNVWVGSEYQNSNGGFGWGSVIATANPAGVL